MDDKGFDRRDARPTLCVLLACALFMTACGSSSSGPDCRFNQAWIDGQCRVDITVEPITLVGGIWRGLDVNGRDVVAYVSVFGNFRFVDGSGNQGSGILAVGATDNVASNFRLVTQLGDTFTDGTTFADCTFTGSIIERQSLTMTEICTTTTGLQFQEDLSLTFDPLYDRPASLATIAGNFQTPGGNVLNIAGDGTIFVQDAVSGCVTNGLARTTLSNANMYFYEYGIENCNASNAIWNGTSFSGLAVIDDTVSPQSLNFAVVGEVGGVAISLADENGRL